MRSNLLTSIFDKINRFSGRKYMWSDKSNILDACFTESISTVTCLPNSKNKLFYIFNALTPWFQLVWKHMYVWVLFECVANKMYIYVKQRIERKYIFE